jgi:cell division protein FtsW (lipid II flippase)
VSVTEPERPKAPWHPFPLVELCVLAGIVLLVLGLLDFQSDRGKAMLVTGMLLGSLGGLDTALREHFSGYRSHAMLIAALPAVAAAAILYFAGAPWLVVSVVPVLVFVATLPLLLRAYRRRER